MSREPFVTPVTPSFVDNTIAPPGKHVVHLFGGHAPHTLKEGDWTTRKDELVRNVMRVMDEHAPGFSSGIIDMQVLTPPDIEAKIGSPHGHIFHGELQIDQLFWARPAPHWADYRTPIKGLYQCGSSAHPGGGVGGVVGHNAAREILRDRPMSAAARRPFMRAVFAALLLAPALSIIAAGFVAPLIRLAILSFSAPAGPLAAYRELVTVDVYRVVLRNTVVLALVVSAVSLVIGFALAVALTRLKAGVARHRSSPASCCRCGSACWCGPFPGC